MKPIELAPIILFVYNRLSLTMQVIEALKKNSLAQQSILYIYSDAPQKTKDAESVKKLRNYIHTIDGFKHIHILEREKNYGLAKNIIEGVTEIINKHGKIIVLEDDIVVSNNFLSFMNKALDFYSTQKKVWHINTHVFPINTKGFKNNKIVFARQMDCWGWATWADRWQYFEKNTQQLIETFTEKDIFEFNLCQSGEGMFWQQVLMNHNGTLNTWAIFWYAIIFKNKGLCATPIYTMVENIGLTSGEHFSGNHQNSVFINKINESKIANWKFNKKIIENKKFLNKNIDFHYPSPSKKTILIKKLKRNWGYLKRYKNKSFKEKILSLNRVIRKKLS